MLLSLLQLCFVEMIRQLSLMGKLADFCKEVNEKSYLWNLGKCLSCFLLGTNVLGCSHVSAELCLHSLKLQGTLDTGLVVHIQYEVQCHICLSERFVGFYI